MTSLRMRAVAGGVVWAIFSILIGVFGLASYLDNQTQKRFDELLISRHTEIVIDVANNTERPQSFRFQISDPAYRQPFSGLYWQIQAPDGEIYVSASLVDLLLPGPTDPDERISIGNFAGPTGEDHRRIQEWVTLADGSRWHVQVASSLQSLWIDRNELRGNLVLAFGLITIIGVMGAFLQASATLSPLLDLRKDVSSRWNNDGNLDPAAYPEEVAPLVTDINTLLDRNRDIITISRRQAADLAHAAKTPSAIMRNELEQLLQSGQPVQQSIEALDRLDAQLKRSFARMRANGGHAATNVSTDLDKSLGRMTRAFLALARNEQKILTSEIAPALRVHMDQNDFEEVMGNLLDNAMKWSAGTIHVSAKSVDDFVLIEIDDDGPGIPDADFAAAIVGGQRLDSSKPGTGLGLAIAADLVHAYGGQIVLSASPLLGGLQVAVKLKTFGL